MAVLEFGPEKIRLINTLNEFSPYSAGGGALLSEG
jgi:hypothetical protein